MRYLIEMQAGGTRALAFGLNWHSTLGNDPDAVAARIAIREKAAAYTRGGTRSTVVGLLHTARRSELPGRRTEVFSAAAVFARAFARGPVALTLQVPGGIWLSAAFDGVVVVGSDVIYPNRQQAQAHLAQLRETYRGLQVYGDQDDERRLPPNVLLKQLDASTRLRRTPRSYTRAPILAGGLVAALSVWAAAQYLHDRYMHAGRARQQAERAAAQTTDPIASWQAAIADWAARLPDHGGQTLQHMLQQIEQLPVSAGRWDLAEVDCQPGIWRCAARYRRARLGTNQELRQHLPESWALHWPNLDEAVAQWAMTPPATVATLNPDTLPSATALTLFWASSWQALSPALSDLALNETTQVALEAPLDTRPDGTQAPLALPQDPRVRLPIARSLIVNGPMRSLYLLDLPNGSVIERLQIRRTPGAAVALAASTLTATLTGTVHAR